MVAVGGGWRVSDWRRIRTSRQSIDELGLPREIISQRSTGASLRFDSRSASTGLIVPAPLEPNLSKLASSLSWMMGCIMSYPCPPGASSLNWYARRRFYRVRRMINHDLECSTNVPSISPHTRIGTLSTLLFLSLLIRLEVSG